MTGILTDRDLRNRVLAEGRAGDTAVADVMTPRPLTVPATAFLFEALMLLTRHGIHHMPAGPRRRAGRGADLDRSPADPDP